MNESLRISYGSATDSGLVKKFNTDSILDFKIPDGHMFVVCDGHNGNEGHGALASKLTSEGIKKYFHNCSYTNISKALGNAVSFTNSTLFEQARKDQKYKGIGSTLVALIFHAGRVQYVFAGDSRIYVFKNSQLCLLSSDHVDNPAEAVGAEVRVLIGENKNIDYGICTKPLQASTDDIYLLCSDGLTDQVDESEIAGILGDTDKAPEHKCHDLLEVARKKGGKDCASVQVVEFSAILESNKKKIGFLKPVLIGVAAVIALELVGFVGFKGYKVFTSDQDMNPVVEKQMSIDNVEPLKSEVTIEKQKKSIPLTNVDILKNTTENKISINTITVQPYKIQKDISQIHARPAKILSFSPTVYYNYRVRRGDSLYRIAIIYNTTQKALIESNVQKAKKIIAGSTLKIPVLAIHTVKAGESLSVIAAKYNVKISDVSRVNTITKKAVLADGQVLIIPQKILDAAD